MHNLKNKFRFLKQRSSLLQATLTLKENKRLPNYKKFRPKLQNYYH